MHTQYELRRRLRKLNEENRMLKEQLKSSSACAFRRGFFTGSGVNYDCGYDEGNVAGYNDGYAEGYQRGYLVASLQAAELGDQT